MKMCTLHKTKVQKAAVHLCDLRNKSHIFQPRRKISGIHNLKKTNKTGLYQVNPNVIAVRQLTFEMLIAASNKHTVWR